mgnify:CR=1 FL=1
MTFTEQLMTIGLCVLGTYLTRALPFLIFSEKRETPRYIRYLGDALPSAIFAMLVVYCLKDVSIVDGNHGLPEFLSISLIVILHLRWRQMLISIAGGTLCYMLLIQFVFT